MTICQDCKQERELPDGILCEECIIHRENFQRDLDKEDEYVIITREMALDAGCPEMEGHLWKW